MPRPAPRSGWCSGRTAWRCSRATGATPTSWSRRCTTIRLSGLSLDGERFFYDNPLASRGGHHRWTWHRCPCCPPNIARLIASLGSYVYSTAPGELTAHLYVQSDARLQVDGVKVAIRQTSNYPWEGAIAFAIDPETRSGVHAAPAHPRLVPLGRAQPSTARGSTSRP